MFLLLHISYGFLYIYLYEGQKAALHNKLLR